MIPDTWGRIAAIQWQKNGDAAAVWMAYDRETDTVHVYDCCVFRKAVLAVVAEGLNARGRKVPVGWQAKDKPLADELLNRGCNMLYDSHDEDDAMAEVVALTIQERMHSGRFRVEQRLGEWLAEYKTFQRHDGKIPRETHPIMAATRTAIAMMEQAREKAAVKPNTPTYPKVSIV